MKLNRRHAIRGQDRRANTDWYRRGLIAVVLSVGPLLTACHFGGGTILTPAEHTALCKLACVVEAGAQPSPPPADTNNCLLACDGTTPSPSSTTPTIVPTATATETATATSTPVPTPTPTPTSTGWVTRLIRVNGFAGCNPYGGPGRTRCHGDRTFWFTMPDRDLLSVEVNCQISAARNPNIVGYLQKCLRFDSAGTPCGGAPACDQDHLSCERVRIGCNGKNWDDPRGSVLKVTGQIQCTEADNHYGFDCVGTPNSQYLICAHPFSDAHTEDGTPILVQGTGEFCQAGTF